MSDIVNPRSENYYLHPKKKIACWRADRNLSQKENIPASEGQEIESVNKEHFNMVPSPNFKRESTPQDGTSNAVEIQSSERNQSHELVSQDSPLDFSVKSVGSSNRVHDSEFKNSFSDSPVNGDSKVPHNFEYHSSVSSEMKSMAVAIPNGKISLSPVPIYNGSSKFQRPKQRRLNASPPTSHFSTHSATSQFYSENGRRTQSPFEDTSMIHSSTEHCTFQNPGHQRQQFEERSFDVNEPSSSKQLSRENSPDNKSYKGSILQEVLVGRPGEMSQIPELNKYLQKMNSSSHPKLRPPIVGTNSASPTNLGLPDTSSLLPAAGTLIPASNPFLQGTSFAYMNGFTFSSAAMNGMNPFGNSSLLSQTMDARPPHTQTPADKKQSKPPVRPFKAITNELLFGIPSTLTHPPINQVMPSGGFFKEYFQGSAKDCTDPPKSSPVSKKQYPETSTNCAINSSPGCSSNDTEPKLDATGSDDSNSSYHEATTSAMETPEEIMNGNKDGRKRSRTLPDEFKDEAYWERRRKNNQAAKRSRDARRQKEDMVAQQAYMFREHNMQLRFQVSAVEEQHQRLQIQYRTITEQCRNLELQVRLMNDKLVHGRCGKCGYRFENTTMENGFGDLKTKE